MIEQHDNSTIFRNVTEANILDFTHIGTNDTEYKDIVINEPGHCFIPGDAIYYDFKSSHYRRALAVNTIMSEVIGVVKEIIDEDNFKLTLKGNIILDRYDSIQTGKPLYLSPVITGRLTDTEPSTVSKIIGLKTVNGIEVDIQRGFYYNEQPAEVYDYRYYTQQEVQDVITEVMNEIY